MIKHDMAVKHDPPNSYGDCFRASLATMFQTPEVTDIPHFLENKDDDYWLRFVEWFADRGLEPRYESASRFSPPGYYILTGASPRHEGTNHSVVAREGKVVHDPHISRAGILKPHVDVICFYLFDVTLYNEWREELCRTH